MLLARRVDNRAADTGGAHIRAADTAVGDAHVMSLGDRLYRWRDRLIANPYFQRVSARFPLTRPIARAQTRALFDLCAGFVYSQILTACVRLDVFKLLQEPKTVAEVARALSLPHEAAERLLRAAVSVRLLSRRSKGRYGLGMLGAAMIGNSGIAAMIAHHEMLYRDLGDPVALLRGANDTHLARYWAYASSAEPSSLGADQVADYSALMAASQSFIAQDVLDAYPFKRHTCLLDVGGGEGAFLQAVAGRVATLNLMLFDLPPVVDRARRRFAQTPHDHRLHVTGGSFLSDSLPHGADLISLVRVLHDHNDDAVLTLLRAVHHALPEKGTLLIAEPMSGVRGSESAGDGYFGFYLMAMGQGRPRTKDEIGALLRKSGFGAVQHWPTSQPLLVSVISARRITV